MAASHSARRRLKVVFLHGFTQTDERLRLKTLAFKTTCSNYLDIKYVCSPHVLKEPPAYFDDERSGKDDDQIRAMEEAAKEDYVKQYGVKESYGNTWYYTGKLGDYSAQIKSAEVIGLDESLKVIYDACKEHQADGIMGFSLGGLMTTIATQKALHDESVGWKPKFCVLFSAPVVGNENVRKLLDQAGKIDIPSLHMISENDTIVKPERSYQLLKYFTEPRVKYHKAGHAVPHTEAKEVYQKFFTRLLDDTL
ncbi:hypothetical protein X943_003526 [Babesia divergens]|uniref:Serine hydrolase domain-containing protein n=1 Tax=Babesia divergens TaxID=32595 RepID=A0AAD9GG92_BABDI|nr:hypothetical protein X943_003526 [Babesia divergens]